MKEEKYFTLSEVQTDIEKIYNEGITRGNYMGFESLHELFSFKDLGTTYIYGAPFSGKTEWWLESLIYFSEHYGWHHAIYTPESGSAHEIYAELLSKYLQKPFYKNIPGHMTEVERMQAENFIHEYFYVIDPGDAELSIKEFYATVLEIEKKHKIKINTTCCDPFNELDHREMSEHGRQDLYIENMLGFIRRDAMSNSRHNVIITHCTDQKQIKAHGTEKYFYPAPSPREIAGGQAWYRKAMNLICLWRPPFGDGWSDAEGNPYQENEVHIIINKYKPKGVGKRGIVKLFFDGHRNRYYEMFNGEKRYAGKKIENLPEQKKWAF